MSVFTSVNTQQLTDWLTQYAIGEVAEIKGISAGITNTNYFVTTEVNAETAVDNTQAKLGLNRYVLTLFEHNTMDELPFFVELMAHLSQHQVSCPTPIVDQNGEALHLLQGKPALLVSCLKGSDVELPSPNQCAQVGETLARMHMASDAFIRQGTSITANPRGNEWRAKTAAQVLPFLHADEQALLTSAINLQAQFDSELLPKGIIHADLFRDNVLFDGETLGGFIDFYYACHDVLAYDLAIAANDWCVEVDGHFDEARLTAMLNAYESVRPLTALEKESWHALLQMAALRFWLSRLYDKHFPQSGELTFIKDPDYFKQILTLRMQASDQASC